MTSSVRVALTTAEPFVMSALRATTTSRTASVCREKYVQTKNILSPKIFSACDCDEDTSESPVCDPTSGQCRYDIIGDHLVTMSPPLMCHSHCPCLDARRSTGDGPVTSVTMATISTPNVSVSTDSSLQIWRCGL